VQLLLNWGIQNNKINLWSGRTAYLREEQFARFAMVHNLISNCYLFHQSGPSEPQGSAPCLLGFPRAARLFVLKGLVVPRWRRRAIALLGARLLLFPGKKMNIYLFSPQHPKSSSVFLFKKLHIAEMKK
jgi:hypothetical protein